MSFRTYLFILISFSTLPVIAQTDLQEPGDTCKNKSHLNISTYGTIGASVRNYTGNQFSNTTGATDEISSDFKIHRIGLCADYDFNKHLSMNGELQFINSSEFKLTNITFKYTVVPEFSISGGLMKLPIGYHGSTNHYLDYYAIGDPEGEAAILPYPMTEGGISLSGHFKKIGLHYNLCASSGLSALNFTSQEWAKNCGNSFSSGNGNILAPAATLKLDYTGIKNLSIGVGGYFCPNVARNMSIYSNFKTFFTPERKVPLTLYFADLQYKNPFFTLRGSFLEGNMGNSYYLTYYFQQLVQNNINLLYTEGNIAKIARTYMGEFGINLKPIIMLFLSDDYLVPDLVPFAHYEYYNTQERCQDASLSIDPRTKVTKWCFGLNWNASKNLTLKGNVTMRTIGDSDTYKTMDDINIGLTYDFSLLDF